MHRVIFGTLLCLLLPATSQAAEVITREQIQQVMQATDAASLERDAAGIGIHLCNSFERVIEFPYKELMATVRIDKMEYLQMIDEGWAGIKQYDYQRDDIEIHIMPDRLSGRSHSTVTEHMVLDGIEMTSRFREYATYEIRDGRTVITQVGGHTLLGDTTPE